MIDGNFAIQLLVNGLVVGALVALAACGYSVLYREFGTLYLGFAAVPGLAAMVSVVGLNLFEDSLMGLPGPLMALAAWLMGSAGALLYIFISERYVWRPSRASPLVEQLVGGAATVLVFAMLAGLVMGNSITPYPQFMNQETHEFGAIFYSDTALLIVATAVVMIYLVSAHFSVKQQLGDAAGSRRVTLVGAAVLGAAAGVGTALLYGMTGPLTIALAAGPLVAFLLGGAGSLVGVAVAGVLFGVLMMCMGAQTGGLFSSHSQELAALVLLLAAWGGTRLQQPHITLAGQDPASGSGTPRESYRWAFGAIVVIAMVGNFGHLLVAAQFFNFLVRCLPWVVITVGAYCAVGRMQLPDLGYCIYPALGAYLYALLNSEHLLPLLGDETIAMLMALPPWYSLVLGAVLAAVVASIVYALAGRRPLQVFAVLTLVLGQTMMGLIDNLYDPVNITNGAQGIGLIRPIGDANDASLIFHVGLLGLAIAVGLLALADHAGSRIRSASYVAAGAIGGLGGALLAARLGYISPDMFAMDSGLQLLLVVLLLKRFGLPGVILGAVALNVLLALVPFAWHPVVFALLLLINFFVLAPPGTRRNKAVATPFGPHPYRA